MGRRERWEWCAAARGVFRMEGSDGHVPGGLRRPTGPGMGGFGTYEYSRPPAGRSGEEPHPQQWAQLGLELAGCGGHPAREDPTPSPPAPSPLPASGVGRGG